MNSREKIYKLEATDGNARAGELTLHGQKIKTPIFMPVGTNGTVKAMTVPDIKSIGYQLILGNTYHLNLRPGDETVKKLGGLHKFMGWDRGILTDSGGFQVFSLGKINKLTEEGVTFQSPFDGSKRLITPEKSIQIQENLGSDIMMVFDECMPIPSDYDKVARSIEMTRRWAKRSFDARTGPNNMFGIIQGANFEDLRMQSLQMTTEIDFDGFAIGGLSVGETKEELVGMTSLVAPKMPENKPRYLMGVGEPTDLVNCVEAGIDMFDCVMPTRNARNGSLFTSKGKISIKQARFKEDPRPLDETCECYVCQNYSRGYLRHIHHIHEILSANLNTYHNLWFFKKLMERARQAIIDKRYAEFKKDFLENYLSNDF